MKHHPLRILLNRLRWTGEDQSRFSLRFIHRGVPGDAREILLSDVDHIGKGWFEILGEDSPIPFHRVLEVVDRRGGDVLWRGRKARGGG